MSVPLQLGTEKVSLSDATGRNLHQNIIADRDFPPFDRVTMDGIAILHKPYANGRREFRIAQTGAAGAPRVILADSNDCVEIMTGAMLPEGADTVIRYEDVQIVNSVAQILDDNVNKGKNIHRQGSDKDENDILVRSGKRITAAEIGIAATVGLHEIEVLVQPKICLISTGDELVPINQKPLAHQIRSSNVHSIASALNDAGYSSDQRHLRDDIEHIKSNLSSILDNYDVVVLSGGVSKGKFDFIPDALAELRVTKKFHRVKQRPGKPFWFGTKDDSTFVFAMPGNPVSCLMGTVRYLIPWIRFSQALAPTETYARLTSDVTFKPDLMYMLHGHAEYREDAVTDFVPIHGHGSGDLASLTESNGFIELPRGKELYQSGEIYRWWNW